MPSFFQRLDFPINATDGSERLLRSPESLLTFKAISLLSFLLISALFLTQIFLDSPLSIGKLTGFLVRLIILCVVLIKYAEICALGKEVLKVFADLDSLIYCIFQFRFPR